MADPADAPAPDTTTQSAAETPVPTPAPAAPALIAVESLDWSSVLVVAAGAPTAGEKRPVIVVETRDDKGQLVQRTYPKGHLYFRTVSEVDFADPAGELVTLGVDILQGGFGGFSVTPRAVHVGPANPVFGAANLAFLRGARTIDILGLTTAQKTALTPWFDGLAAYPNLPEVKVTLL